VAISIIGAPPPRPSRAESVKAALLRAVAAGLCWSDDRWQYPPGTLPWWEARIRLGGRVPAAAFAGAVEDLLAEGKLIEVWLERSGGRDAPHLLMIPGKSSALKRPVAQARGQPEVLAAEPWYAGLSGG
jgi:hypothetical protein